MVLRRPRHRFVVTRAATLLVACALVLAAGPASAVRMTGEQLPWPPRPMFWQASLPDPSVVHDGTTWLAVGTGRLGRTRTTTSQYGGWVEGPALLSHTPAWARSGFVWAPEVERAPDGGWIAYYSVPVAGLRGAEDRCIGVATSPALGTPFVPDDTHPIVCPPAGLAPPADDPLASGVADLPATGVIDPSSYVDPAGRRFLLYRTQGQPSSIRMVRLTKDGLHARGTSIELLRTPGVLENPVMVDRGGWHHLLLSRGDYGGCGYTTVWRRSSKLRKGWQDATQHDLLTRRSTGLCGPGGTDYVEASPASANRLFLHGWVCDGVNSPCPATYDQRQDPVFDGKRVLYVAQLRWTRTGPTLGRWVEGPAWQL